MIDQPIAEHIRDCWVRFCERLPDASKQHQKYRDHVRAHVSGELFDKLDDAADKAVKAAIDRPRQFKFLPPSLCAMEFWRLASEKLKLEEPHA